VPLGYCGGLNANETVADREHDSLDAVGNDEAFRDVHASRLPRALVIDDVGPEERLDGLSAVLDDGVSVRIVAVPVGFDPLRRSPVADHPLVEWLTCVSKSHEGEVFDANLSNTLCMLSSRDRGVF